MYIQLNDMSKVLKCLVIYNEIYTKQVKTCFLYTFGEKKKVLSSLAECTKTGSLLPPEPEPFSVACNYHKNPMYCFNKPSHKANF